MESDELESLTEEQRIARLERKVGQNRLLLTAVALIIVVGLSVSITIGIIKTLRVDEPYAKVSEIEEQIESIETINEQLETINNKLTQLDANYKLSSASELKQALAAQEQSYRTFLSAMKVGMVDLAKMVTGSRTWLDIYTEQIDEVISDSEIREAELNKIELEGRAKTE